MNDIFRIKCPKADLSKSERVDLLFKEIEKWINSKALYDLIKLFDVNHQVIEWNEELKKKINFLKDYAKRWDYRRGKERWEVCDEAFVTLNSEIIMSKMVELGLKNITVPLLEPDYLLPLGGARLSNYTRPQMVKKIVEDLNLTKKKIVALSGTRPISEVEREYINQYAPNALTEFEAINNGMEKVFGVSKFEETKVENENLNLCSAIREYEEQFQSNDIFSLAAPSSQPERRRANSYDTFNYFLEHFKIKKGDRLLLVTSCIYVPFQLLRFMNLAIEGGFEVDCIGSDVVDVGKFCNPSNYLQEVKATIDVIYELSNLYL